MHVAIYGADPFMEEGGGCKVLAVKSMTKNPLQLHLPKCRLVELIFKTHAPEGKEQRMTERLH